MDGEGDGRRGRWMERKRGTGHVVVRDKRKIQWVEKSRQDKWRRNQRVTCRMKREVERLSSRIRRIG